MPGGNPAFMAPKKLSPELEAVVGKGPMSRPAVVGKLWEYIKGDAYEDKESGKKGSSLRKGPNLQDPKNKRMINADAALKKVLGKDVVNMMELGGLVSKHLS